ncbi:MAG: nitroreductase family protein [Bacteroidia bacterium]
MKQYTFIDYSKESYSGEETIKRSKEHLEFLDKRRTVREFSDKPIPKEVLENLVLTASTAPSGAHKQPWTFCVVTDPEIKRQIRIEAEKEEYESYNGRMPQDWLDDLAPIGTDWQKPFLEIAPALIIVFRRSYEMVDGKKKNNYYVSESVGLASGFLLEAIHHCGLVSLTHTPSPMNFLCKVLNRPENEKPFLLIPVGYPVPTTKVPDLKRKSLNEIAVFY